MIIDTDRLTLRPWQETDAHDLFRYASDKRVSGMALWPCHTSEAMSLEVIRQIFIPNKNSFAISLQHTGEVVGCIGLVPQGQENYPVVSTSEREVGYWIGYPFWGKGFTTEALKAFLPYCKDCLGIKSLIITTGILNKGSQRVAEKCGFTQFAQCEIDGTANLAYRLTLI